MTSRAAYSLRRFLADERGNLTMEFVLWLPILLFWFAISAVFYDAYKSRDDAAKASYTIADIVSRETDLTKDRIEQLVDLQRALLPRAEAGLYMRLSSITCTKDEGCLDPEMAASTDYELDWSIVPPHDAWPNPGEPPGEAMDSNSDIPPSRMPVMAEDDSIILVDVVVPFEAFSSWVGIEAQEWAFRVAVWPRLVSKIELAPDAISAFVDNNGGFVSS